MAISVNQTSNQTGNATANTFNLTLSAGSNLVLVVMVAGDSNIDTSSITWGGVALTKRVDQATGATDETIWTLDDPATGNADLVVNQPGTTRFAAGIIVFAGANTHAGSNTANGLSTAATVTLATTGTGNGFVVACLNWVEKAANTITYAGDGTEFFTNTDANDSYQAFAYDDYSSGADVTSDWTKSATDKAWGIATLEITEALPSSGFFFAVDR